MGHTPGEVHFLPPEATPGGDDKTRRHVLLSACPAGVEAATFVYGSTRGTEAKLGAMHVLLNPFATRYQHTGFDEPTYLYMSRLVSMPMADLGVPIGRVVRELPRMLQCVGVALGLGTGTAEGGYAAGSLRGRLVELNAALVREIDARYAVIVTERQYSTRQRYQTIVPVLDGAEYLPTANDVQVTQGAWLRAVGMTSAILTVPDVFSVWHRTLISRALPAVVDQAAMGAVDEALRVHFGL